MGRLKRILFGEPDSTKRWTVFYYDQSLSSRFLKFMFGERGCYRADCDDMLFGPFPVGLVGLVDTDLDTAKYIWIMSIENYHCNNGFESEKDKARKMAEEHMTENMKLQARMQLAVEEDIKTRFPSVPTGVSGISDDGDPGGYS